MMGDRSQASGRGHGAGDRPGPARAAFLLLSGFATIAYASTMEALRAANQIAGRPLYSWRHVSPDGEPASSSSGLLVPCDLDIRTPGETFDYVFVCASDEAVDFREPQTLRWLRRQADAGAMVAGVSGGPFLLARAGVLTGRRMTLHWVYAPVFAEEFPDIDLRRSLYEIDGTRVTCGGGISPLDMMHALLSREHGEALAAHVSDWFLHTEIRSGQAPQRLSFQARLGVSHAGLIRTLEAMEGALEEPLTRAALAVIAGVSERQLDRLFLSEVGLPLGAYYLQRRLDRARRLVRQSPLPLTEVALACGFDRASTFSKAYRRAFELSPRADRALARRPRNGPTGEAPRDAP